MIINDSNPEIDVKFAHLVTYDWTMARTHFHNEYEINLAISGGNRFFCNDTLYDVDEGDLFLFSNKDLHKNMVQRDMKYERYLVFFNKKAVDSIIEDDVDLLALFHMDRSIFKNKITLTINQRLHIIQFLKETIYNLNNTHYGKKTLSTAKLIELLLMIHQFYYENQGSQLIGHHKNHISEKVDITITYINNHLEDPLPLDLLARQVYLNKFYLGEKFKAETGFTINQYIINRRMIVAQTYLQEGLSVIETTAKVGYENESHFIRTFKKHVGMTPKQYAISKR